MKKVLAIGLMVLGLSTGITMVEAATTTTMETACMSEGQYTQIEIKELPESVMQAVEMENPACYFFQAWKSDEGDRTIYKIQLISPSGESFYVKVDEQGESIG